MNSKTTPTRVATHTILLMLGVLYPAIAVHAKLDSVTAQYSENKLNISVKTNNTNIVLFDDVMDQEITRQTVKNGSANFTLDRLPVVPCRVRVESEGGDTLIKAVSGADCQGAKAPPTCQILQPVGAQTIANGGSLYFKGNVTGAKSRYLKYEWDFGGGADARSTKKDAGEVKFNYANDTNLWVTFIASDVTGARCADKILVTVGNPPNKLPAQVPEQAALKGDGEHVVIPFQSYGMAFHDLSYGLYSQVTPSNTLNASVIKKGSVGGDKPVFLDSENADVKYSAASNPTDPAGAGSINSTSQNYPLGSTYADATVRKSDWFDPCMVWKDPKTNETNAGDTQSKSFFDIYLKEKPYDSRIKQPRPGSGVVKSVSGDMTNAECAFSNFFYPNWNDKLAPFDVKNPASFAYLLLTPDQGAAYWSADLISAFDTVKNDSPDFKGFRGVMSANGSPMPGVSKAYVANTPQTFPTELQKETGDNYPGYDPDRNKFSANGLPQFPTDDKGRHNAYPLMRLQAHDKKGKLLATADGVTAVTTEFKCAECHTKGTVGADQSVYDGLRADVLAGKAGLEKYKGREKWIPTFVAPEEIDANRKTDRDVIEQAAMINVARLHDFYYNFVKESGWLGPLEFEAEQVYGKKGDTHVQPGNCTDYCHKSNTRADPRRYNMAPVFDADAACPEYSDSLHNIHGRLIGKMDANFKGTIERDPVNRELKLADLTADNKTKSFLLTAKDSGTPDESCYFCHAGKQDKYQHDVMSAAGVNCIDCHGDLAVLAGGGAMVSRDKGVAPSDSRTGKGDLTAPIDMAKLVEAYQAKQSSYAKDRTGEYYYVEKGNDGIYRRNGKVVTTWDMASVFISKTTGVENKDGTFTLTKTTKDKDGKDVVEKETLTQDKLFEKIKEDVNGWLLKYVRIPWAEEPSCANCHSGEGDEPVKRRAYDMTTGKFKLLETKNERFAENLLPKKHDSSYTLIVKDGEDCPAGTYSDTLGKGKNVCVRGLFKDSVDRHGLVSCAACHGATHATWPNPNPYANDNVTAMQLQGHTGTLLECNVCHTDDAFKEGRVDGIRYGDGILAGPHNMHPVNDKSWWKSTDDKTNNGGYHNQFAKKPGMDGGDQCATCHGKDHKGSRLSKSPVERILNDGKGKTVKVKAGQQISCDLCHSLEQSFKK